MADIPFKPNNGGLLVVISNWAIYHCILGHSLKAEGVPLTGVADELISALDYVYVDQILLGRGLGSDSALRHYILSRSLIELNRSGHYNLYFIGEDPGAMK
jgi:hypothetical protein